MRRDRQHPDRSPTKGSTHDRSSLRWSAWRELTGLLAVSGGAALVLLLLWGAPATATNLTALLLVGDLVAWRIADVRLRATIERIQAPLAPWRRPGPTAALVEV